MHLSNIIPLCLICFHVIESYTPAALRALATIQNQKARAIANALTLRARAQYNAAMARSRMSNPSLLDRRIIRDSNTNSEAGRASYEPVPDQGESYRGYYDRNYHEDGFEELLVPQNYVENSGNENFQGALEMNGKENEPQYSCMVQEFQEEIRPEDLPQISVNFNEEYQPPINMPTDGPENSNLAYTDVNQNGGCPECQAAIGGQPTEAYSQYYNLPNEAKSAEPVLRPHGRIHSHIHTHIHGTQPILQPSIIPTGHVVAPAVNVHVVQNQNAAVTPQFATSATLPGYGTTTVNTSPAIHAAGKELLHHGMGVNQNAAVTPQFAASAIHSGYGTTTVNTAPAIHAAGKELLHHGMGVNHGPVNAGHGTNAFQSQTVQTQNAPVIPGGYINSGTGIGGSSIVQTQSVHQGLREAEGLDGMEMLGAPNEGTSGVEENDADERLGTFFPFHMRTPEFKDYSDMSRPQNRQGIVKYLENEQMLHSKLIPHPHYKGIQTIKTVHPAVHESHAQKLSPDHVQLGESNFKNERLGTFLIDPSRIEPIPTLPPNFIELDPEKRREAIMNILETEQRNIKSLFEQFDESQSQDLNSFTEHHPQESNVQDEFHNAHNAEHFHAEQQEPHPNFDVEDVDDSQRLEATQHPYHEEKDDENVSQMLSKFIENDPDVQKQIGISNDELTLGNIFEVPERRFSEDYLRSSRSPAPIEKVELEKLLEKERKLINTLKKNAKHDEDLMMIGYIGDSLLDDFEKRVNKITRRKREIGGHSLPLNSLILDPRTRLDIPRTLENLGSVTKTAFENEKAPMYHVRNMMGSAQDAMFAAMKIPTKNFLIPSQYQIVNTQGQNERVGAINPSVLKNTDRSNAVAQEQNPNDGIIDTFNKVGSAVRESVLSSQEALGHVGQMATHAKSAIHSGRYAPPRMILRQIPHIIREPTKKATIITPRIFDISQDDGRVGSTLAQSQPDFVRLGRIFDAVGISNPNARKVEFEKVIFEPRSFIPYSETFGSIHPSKLLKTFRNMLEGVRIEKASEEDFVENALNTLNDVKSTVGVNSLRDFLLQMRQRVGTVTKNGTPLMNSEKNIIQNTPQNILAPPANQQSTIKPQIISTVHPKPTVGKNNPEPNPDLQKNSRPTRTADNQLASYQDRLGVSLFPHELEHPFMGHTSEPLQPYHVSNIEDAIESNMGHITDANLGQILGAINPMMFEKIFNESLTIRNSTESPHAIFHHHHEGHSHGDHMVEDESLGTSMAIEGNMLKPFMGQASQKMQENFFEKFTPQFNEEDSQYLDLDIPITPQLSNILQPPEHHIPQEEPLEYDEYE